MRWHKFNTSDWLVEQENIDEDVFHDLMIDNRFEHHDLAIHYLDRLPDCEDKSRSWSWYYDDDYDEFDAEEFFQDAGFYTDAEIQSRFSSVSKTTLAYMLFINDTRKDEAYVQKRQAYLEAIRREQQNWAFFDDMLDSDDDDGWYPTPPDEGFEEDV